MNGKQLFCLSLIILSVVMGLHWFKNKPKERKKVKDRPRVALDLDDLQIQDDKPPADSPDGDDPPLDTPPEDSPDDIPGDETGDTPEDQPGEGDIANQSPEDNNASSTTDLTASGSLDLPPELNDPIIIALRSMPRNPFETSPYAKLVEKLREQESQPEEEEIIKTTQLLQANFTATIRTRQELLAVIDSKLYRKGDPFGDNQITDIKPELVKIDTPSSLFIIPKVGVRVNIATDGSYTFEDSYRQN